MECQGGEEEEDDEGRRQAPATENLQSGQIWHSHPSDYNLHKQKGMLVTNIQNK